MSILPFDFNGNEIRTLGTWDAPLFVAADVCAVLEISNVSQACSYLDEDEKGIISSDTLGGKQDLLCVSESGLYSLVLRSRKPQAKAFKKWITAEVIPSIRKTGQYSTGQTTAPLKSLPAYHEAIATNEFLRSVTSGLVKAGLDPLLVEAHIISQTVRFHPDVAPQLESAKLLIPQQTQLQSTDLLLNPTDIGNRLNPKISPKAVNLMLTGCGLQFRTGSKDNRYELTESGKQFGRVTLNQAKNSDKTVQQIKWKASVVQHLQSRMAV
jgi:prophage antirepressor-like protein